jgi:hypothetical protein
MQSKKGDKTDVFPKIITSDPGSLIVKAVVVKLQPVDQPDFCCSRNRL